ncbi:pentatricopeptide repeat-containing protein 1, mitochondrial [Dermatophagoides pteronyssinus]|uniref:pentatricopeptide repeat-containing protein 1, mitochondrial n=1 Tax=Dermatophagoides pteronyssinus TaxID=6956 RepID=UPI003F678195
MNSLAIQRSIWFGRIFSRLRINEQNVSKYSLQRQLCSSSPKVIDFSQLEPDKFGDLVEKFQQSTTTTTNKIKKSKPLKSERLAEDQDGYDRLEIKRGIKISLPGYERMIEEVYRRRPRNLGRLLEIYRQMVYDDRYKPNRNIYTMLINACAQAGYTRKAFELFDEMKRYDYQPTRAMITALFNACANCPMDSSTGDDQNYGLNLAIKLRDELDSNGFHYNQTHYNVMIKVFALFDDQPNIDSTIAQMKRHRIEPNQDTYCMLLMGAIQQPKNGLYIATELMRKILHNQPKISLNVAPFNLFLRSIRDCRFESETKVKQLVDNSANTKSLVPQSTNKLPMKQSEIPNNLPNLLINNQSDIVSIDFQSLDSVTNRFLLFGGIDGFLQLMQHYRVEPNLKTFTLMAELLADHHECFELIQKALDRYNQRSDVCLYNVFIKIYAKNKNREKCEQMIREMQREQLRPDIMTFGALAFACTKMNDARKFLDEMKQCSIRPNNNVMGTLINLACGHKDLHYVQFLLSYMDKHNLKLTIMDIERIEIMLNYYREQTVDADRNNQSIPLKIRQSIAEVNRQFRQMLKNTTIELDTNVWSQWKQNDHIVQKSKYHSSISYMKEKINLRLKKYPNNNPKFDDLDEID